MKALLPATARSLIEPHLPPALGVTWWSTSADAFAGIADADVAWIDLQPPALVGEALAKAGPGLRWLTTIYAGLDTLPLDQLRELGITVTNGAGFNAVAVAEYAVLGILTAAKRLDQVVRSADRHEWPSDAPGKMELFESRALILGMGTIGALIAQRLEAFGVVVTGATRSGRNGTLKPDEWQATLGQQDWVVVAAPSTGATENMIGPNQLAAMKPSAWLINVARGANVDQAALLKALREGSIAGAFLDTVHPEPLPSDDPLWSTPNALLSMHLSGRSTSRMLERAAKLFLQNLRAFTEDEPMQNVVDLEAGY